MIKDYLDWYSCRPDIEIEEFNILHVLFTNLYWPINWELFGIKVILCINTYSQTSLQWRYALSTTTLLVLYWLSFLTKIKLNNPDTSSSTKILHMWAPVRWIYSRSTMRWITEITGKCFWTSLIFPPSTRAVTKVSSCRVNTTSRQGIKKQGISFASIFLLFSYESRRGPRS